MRSSLFLALTLALGGGAACIGTADAQSMREVRKQMEASMTLNGVINIGREGQVEDFQLDRRDKVSADVAGMVEGSVKGWRFEPVLVNGQPVRARTEVRLRLLADSLTDATMQIRIADANFGPVQDENKLSSDDVTALKMRPPAYPERAYAIGGQGEVTLLVKVGRDGKVADVIAERTNLRVVAPERQMQMLRDVLAKASVSTARSWTFNPPTTGEDKDNPFWTVRIPVNFALSRGEERYGRWSAYIPGPRQQAPWKTGEDEKATGTDLLPEGGVYMVGRNDGPRLLTPLG